MSPLVALLLASLALCSAQDPPAPKLPNIGFVGYGYNIFAGNPHSTKGFDPGFGEVPIFALTYNDQATTADGKWTIPDNVGIPGSPTSCDVSGTSTTVQTASDYQSSLAVDAKADLTYFKASFSTSTDYKMVDNSTSYTKSVFTQTTAQCQTYLVNVNAFIHPNYSSSFYTQALRLPTTFDANNATAFWTFIDLVGTHFPSQIVYGSRWGYSFMSTQSQWTTLNSMDLNINVAANYAGEWKAGVSLGTNYSQEMAQNFSSLTTSTSRFSLGCAPPADADDNSWLNTALTSTQMDPLQYELTELSVLFSPDATDDPQLNARYDAFKTAVYQYCSLHLLPKGRLSSCNAPPTPPPPPATTGHGALACGNGGQYGECNRHYAVVYDGSSDIQAQAVALDFCSGGCQITWAFDGSTCFGLAIATNGAWSVGYSAKDAEARCLNYSKGAPCTVISSGCPAPPPSNANWGAIACNGGCANTASTPSSGYPDRIEAHKITMSAIGNDAVVAIDFNTQSYPCGAIAKGNGGWAAAAGSSILDAQTSAMNACQATFGGCSLAAHSCIDTSGTNQRIAGAYMASHPPTIRVVYDD